MTTATLPKDETSHASTATNAVSDTELFRIRALVRNAAEHIAPIWPLKTFIATNPLLGLENFSFGDAASKAEKLFGAQCFVGLNDYRQRVQSGDISSTALTTSFEQATDGLRNVTIAGQACDAQAWVRQCLDGTEEKAASAQIAEQASRIITAISGKHEEASAGPATDPKVMEAVNRQLMKWCTAYFDEGVATLNMPFREKGLYGAWTHLAIHDPEVRAALTPEALTQLARLPEQADIAIHEAMRFFGAEGKGATALLVNHLAAMPGWAGYIKKQAEQNTLKPADANLTDYLGIRLTLHALLSRQKEGDTHATLPKTPEEDLKRLASFLQHAQLDLPESTSLSEQDLAVLNTILKQARDSSLALIFLKAAEESYREPLIETLKAAAQTSTEDTQPVDAQLVFCIDVRSEPFRRALESEGNFETLGYAGFFGIPIQHTNFTGGANRDLCPVLLTPKHEITDQPLDAHVSDAHRLRMVSERNTRAKSLWGGLKQSVLTPFALAEATGAVSGAAMAGRTLAPRRASTFFQRLSRKGDELQITEPRLQHAKSTSEPNKHLGLTLDEQIFYAQALLEMTGLKAPFGKLVVLCAHGSTTTNNAYASALDCGACGGNHGAANARVMATILNSPEVREGLKKLGHQLPDEMVALAAEHDTTTDEVTLFGAAHAPASHQEEIKKLETALARAGDKNRQNRIEKLSAEEKPLAEEILYRSADWAQVRPEWGLARNAAFIVAPRTLTKDIDLGGRSFLHSYDWRIDPEGTSLTVILTAPMVVAQWINCQYYFSTVDNHVFGSGTKITQNVVGGIGVAQGNESDLMTGLPWQSLFDDQGEAYHEPLRLLTFVVAPRNMVEHIITANDVLKRLFDNEWVALHVLDPESGLSARYQPGLTWHEHV